MFRYQPRFFTSIVEPLSDVVSWRHFGSHFLCLFLLFSSPLCAQEAAAPEGGEATAPAPAVALKYQTLPVHPALAGNTPEVRQTRSRIVGEIRAMLRGELTLEDESNKAKFDGWYTQYLFASMTQPENFATLDIARQKFLRQDLGFTKNQAVHDYLLKDLTLPLMTKIVRENYHPAVRYNAMLIISHLNIVE
ncbi:MAG: hypothetical protein VB857_10335, partial [Pirellulaceae bacterium]